MKTNDNILLEQAYNKLNEQSDSSKPVIGEVYVEVEANSEQPYNSNLQGIVAWLEVNYEDNGDKWYRYSTEPVPEGKNVWSFLVERDALTPATWRPLNTKYKLSEKDLEWQEAY